MSAPLHFDSDLLRRYDHPGLWLLSGVHWSSHWLHALTMGVFGTMILAVMTRASLGHAGRPLVVSRTRQRSIGLRANYAA